ncbi:potassium channel family protein [Cerasicoccus arenae]|uniref:Potassium channel domain-containing protein n=1 Tax=Cerasicoccus arenae TaxID=424488 RepID=A0A8J3DCG1_9BACT|nr:potassium channel family protein [Cerasicoccus arenae]MBK1857873.1 hypothetical protein [Cerasicoccus arenae]GHC09383.1 hypothetical protein GCM10007047_28240 [Cerasicoccus arenae]
MLTPPRTSTSLVLGKYFWLLLSLLFLIILVPIVDDDDWGAPVLGVIAMLTLVFGLRAVAGERRTLFIAILLGIIAYGLSTRSYLTGTDVLIPLPFQLAFYGYINLTILRSILEAKKITADVICGGIAVYLLLGINWAILFAAIELIHPGSLVVSSSFDQNGMSTPMDFLYFSFTTLTTLGYGDIVPVSNAARAASIGAAVSGVLFIAVFIGRLVGLTTSQAHHAETR